MQTRTLFKFVLLVGVCRDVGWSQQDTPSVQDVAADQAIAATTTPSAEQIDAFAKKMTGATLVGRFTDGSAESKEERYEIKEAKKLKVGDLWLFNARIVYGETDLTVPVPIQVKWAGKTPVIALDQVTIPGMGTFSAHVIIDGDRYAGTWQHDEQGGHLFGLVETEKEAPQ